MQPDLHADKARFDWQRLIIYSLLLLVLTGGAALRTVGMNWDADKHLHPDERFLSMVQAAISPVEISRAYFDTATSSLNPANRGYEFFVYGTLPIILIRYAGEWLGQVGYDPITLVGRYLSAAADVCTILLVYLIGSRLFKREVGLLAAAFYAFMVLPIQLSHFMTVDTFTNTFGMLTVLAGVLILRMDLTSLASAWQLKDAKWPALIKQTGTTLPYVLFGIGLGAATASKINAVTLALLLPMIEAVRYFQAEPGMRSRLIKPMLINMTIAALTSFVVFRIGQPYAFEGPGFLNFSISEKWWSSMRSLQAQNAGDVDFPPALQWARRPLSFAWTNMVVWGMGLPLGLNAWASFLAMGWQLLKGKHRHSLPLWVWTALYFTWQATAWVRSMRYQMLVYPLLALFAAWGLFSLWQQRHDIQLKRFKITAKLTRAVGIVLVGLVLIGSAAWAFAFTRIYTRDHSRVAASKWIYENIPGPINLGMEGENGEAFSIPLPYRSGDSLLANQLYRMPFEAQFDGYLSELSLPNVLDQSQPGSPLTLTASILDKGANEVVLTSASITKDPSIDINSWQGGAVRFQFMEAVQLQKGHLYLLQLGLDGENGQLLLNGVPELSLVGEDASLYTQPLLKFVQTLRPEMPYTMNVGTNQAGLLKAVSLPAVLDYGLMAGEKTLRLTLQTAEQGNAQTAVALLRDNFTGLGEGKGTAYTFEFETPLLLEYPQGLFFTLEMIEGQGSIGIASQAPVHESSWDDALPLGLDGIYPYSDSGGIYRGDLNFELYWPDEVSKRTRFENLLDQADYIFISSNRQWGTITRVPERYPLTSTYYRALLGCPEGKDLVWCYNVAEPGQFEGQLGFELAAVFTSFPNLGNLEFNSQFAEEAFTVYDHPKALVFKKTKDYDPQVVRDILRAVDLSKVINITPRQASNTPKPNLDGNPSPQETLMLPEDKLALQRAGGTWSELFNRQGLLNTSPVLAVLVFYLFSLALGWVIYPLLRLALPGLKDRGYAFARLAGFLILAYLSFVAGSAGVPFTRGTIALMLGLIILSCGVLAFLQRKELLADIHQNWRQFLTIEIISLAAFVFFLLVRLGNPDLWHPWKGGEKPMDFSYLNAVIKSTIFPAYDPWFAGGYINYYYYGFVVVGVPIKLLGIIPSTAYNIVLPLWYSMLISGAFSIGWNIYHSISANKCAEHQGKKHSHKAFLAGIFSAALLGLLGNMGTVRLISDTFQKMGSGGQVLDGAGLFQRLGWFVQGMILFFQKVPLPLYPGDWYWVPSRVIPGEAITEFPYFTYLYADLHAHLIALPMAVFAVAWGLSFLFAKGSWNNLFEKPAKLSFALRFLLGALIIGALKPTNTWDYYTYLVLNLAIIAYVGWQYFKPRENIKLKAIFQRLLAVTLPIMLLVGLTVLLYQPFNAYFKPGYSEIGYWTGAKTPLGSYFTHWALFLFIITFWLSWETHQWMASTPLSALQKLNPYKPYIVGGLLGFGLILAGLLITKVVVALVILPLGLWTLVLLLRPGQADGKRLVLFMIGTGLLLSLMVELVYLVGDIGRMNVVFKLYMQAWVFFALASGACLAWLLGAFNRWCLRTQVLFEVLLIMLTFSAALFPLMATTDKIKDRMQTAVPLSLDGMTYMAYSTHYDMGSEMDLSEDYWAIRWMQDNIQGSPVILEGQAYEYRWGNRFTIYTGLPGVVGWNYHQRQQRAILRSNVVQERVDQVGQFYLTEDRNFVQDFLAKYEVSYIVFGQLERLFYPGAGLEKYEAWNGIIWDEVFRYGSTVIYQVRR